MVFELIPSDIYNLSLIIFFKEDTTAKSTSFPFKAKIAKYSTIEPITDTNTIKYTE